MRIEEFKVIEGTASDVPQVRLYNKYLLFRLSGAPVELRVSGPITIGNGDAVRIVGRHNWNGVFEAMAYNNRSSGVCGNSDELLVQKLTGVGVAIIGGMLALFAAPFMSLIVHEALLFTDPVFQTFALLGLLIALVGYVIFVRSRSKIRALERLINADSRLARRTESSRFLSARPRSGMTERWADAKRCASKAEISCNEVARDT